MHMYGYHVEGHRWIQRPDDPRPLALKLCQLYLEILFQSLVFWCIEVTSVLPKLLFFCFFQNDMIYVEKEGCNHVISSTSHDSPRPRDAPDRVVAAIASAVDQGPMFLGLETKKSRLKKLEDQKIMSISEKCPGLGIDENVYGTRGINFSIWWNTSNINVVWST